jgi:hypothetical protein
VGLTDPTGYLSGLVAQSQAVRPPTGPPRCRGIDGRLPTDLSELQKEIEATAAAETFDGRLERGTELAVEMASFLYAAGAHAAAWRVWSGLAGHGFLLLDQPVTACAYLVIGGEWQTLGEFGAVPEKGSPGGRTLWRIVTGAPNPGEPSDTDATWYHLAEAIPAEDWPRVDHALTEIAAFWIGESEDDGWDFYRPHYAPIFEPEVCAAAAVAVRRGYSSDNLNDETKRFLEAGLMPGFPNPLAG